MRRILAVLMCVVMLRVDMPDHGLAGPQGSNQRVLSTHQIQIASPEHFVKLRLGAGLKILHCQLSRLWLRLHDGRGTAWGDE